MRKRHSALLRLILKLKGGKYHDRNKGEEGEEESKGPKAMMKWGVFFLSFLLRDRIAV